jgi:hypothetical protein
VKYKELILRRRMVCGKNFLRELKIRFLVSTHSRGALAQRGKRIATWRSFMCFKAIRVAKVISLVIGY